MLAPDGAARPSTRAADGFVRGEGCGVVVLKRLSDALRDGDRDLAVIRGSAVNQDGRSNGLTAPNGLAQQAVIRQALAHGRRRPRRDRLRRGARHRHARSAIRSRSRRWPRCSAPAQPRDRPAALGSVKTNIGHLEAAAGIAGLIKVGAGAASTDGSRRTCTSTTLNPHIAWRARRLQFPRAATPWPAQRGSRAAPASARSASAAPTPTSSWKKRRGQLTKHAAKMMLPIGALAADIGPQRGGAPLTCPIV